MKDTKFLTDDEVEVELKRLRSTPEFKAAMAEKRLKYRRRQMLYEARHMFKRGTELLKNRQDEEYFDALDKLENGNEG